MVQAGNSLIDDKGDKNKMETLSAEWVEKSEFDNLKFGKWQHLFADVDSVHKTDKVLKITVPSKSVSDAVVTSFRKHIAAASLNGTKVSQRTLKNEDSTQYLIFVHNG